MRYLGTYEKKLTKRGKFCVPVKWRNESRQYVVELVSESILRVTDAEYFEMGDISDDPKLRRHRLSFCWTVDCNESWWIQIPEIARHHLAAGDNLVWAVGVGHGFEILNHSVFENRMENVEHDICRMLED